MSFEEIVFNLSRASYAHFLYFCFFLIFLKNDTCVNSWRRSGFFTLSQKSPDNRRKSQMKCSLIINIYLVGHFKTNSPENSSKFQEARNFQGRKQQPSQNKAKITEGGLWLNEYVEQHFVSPNMIWFCPFTESRKQD